MNKKLIFEVYQLRTGVEGEVVKIRGKYMK